MHLISRWYYYISSIPTLLLGVRNVPRMLISFLPFLPDRYFILKLRNELQFFVRSAMDVWIIKETCLDQDYNKNAVSINNNWCIIDIGAGLGDFSIYAAQKNSEGIIYAYEPSPESFELLQKNIALNNAQNVRAFQLAVGSHDSFELETSSNTPVLYSTVKSLSNTETTKVKANGISLDGIFEMLKIEKCDFLKVDCEGAEYDIFFNTNPEIFKKIRYICLEYHNNVTQFSHTDLIRFFEHNGYEVHHKPNPAHIEIGFLYAKAKID